MFYRNNFFQLYKYNQKKIRTCCFAAVWFGLVFRSRYTFDLNVKEGHEGYHTLMKCSTPIGYKELRQVEDTMKKQGLIVPPIMIHSGGNTSSTTSSSQSKSSITQQQHRTTTTTGPVLTVAQQVALAAKRNKMAMTIATSPGQALLMNALMLWFSGKQLNIFSITTTSSAITTPLSNILGVENVFRQLQQNNNNNNNNSNRGTGSSSSPPDENDVINLNVPKLIYVALNLLWLGIGLYKMSSMRLLPTTSAVWSYKVVWKEMLETTSIPPDHNLFY